MGKALFAALVLVAFTLRPAKPSSYPSPAPRLSGAPTEPTCDESLWKHVYHGTFPAPKDRLRVIKDCTTVTGTLYYLGKEADGDTHMRLALDSQFADLINQKNSDGEDGMLVVESICEKKPTQKDTVAEGVCKNFSQHLYKKGLKGKHVAVTGAYVEDEEEQHGWREIHPVTSITVIH